MMRDDEADAFVEEGKELRLLRISDVLHHVVEHDAIVAQQIITVVSRGSFNLGDFRERDLRIFLEHAEELIRFEAMATGHQENIDLFLRTKNCAARQQEKKINVLLV